MTRFFAQYEICGEHTFPLDYRSAFMRLIKTSLDSNIGYKTGMFQEKPFCFAVRFDKRPIIKNKHLTVGEKVKIYISTPDNLFATNIYNGMLNTKTFTVFNSAIQKPKFMYLNEYKFRKRQTKLFYTLAPIVIRNMHDKSKYVTPTDDEFEDSMHNALKEQWSMYKSEGMGKVAFSLIKYKKVAMTHYGGLVLGFSGVFTLEANPNVLEFFYKSGVGYRRSNGFGFIGVA